MKTISVIGYNRPEYLTRTLTALSQCRGIEDYEIIVSVDDAANQMDTLVTAHSFAAASWHDRFHVWAHPFGKLGVNRHPRDVYDHLFSWFQTDFTVVFEDDIVPSPDALELCDWFYNLPTRDEYACLLLHGATKDQSNPLRVDEFNRFCPWGWAFTRAAWENIFRPEWNAKPETPSGGTGWDWSCGLTIQRHALKVLVPVLSRTLNIGREGGTYESPDNWDEWAKELVASDGTHGKDYLIGNRLPAGYEKDVDSWVTEALDETHRSTQS